MWAQSELFWWVASYQLAWVALETAFSMRYRNQRAFTENGVAKGRIPLAIAIVAAIVFVSSTLASYQRDFTALSGFAIGLGALGLGLRLASIQKLGDRFLDAIELMPGHQIEFSGIYKYLKHPAEIGFLLLMFGYALLCQSAVGVGLSLIVLTPLSIGRMRLENQLIQRYLQHSPS